MASGISLHLLRLDGVRNQAEQVRHALASLKEEFVVVTDADAVLDPGCLRALVTELIADPELAIAGAVVRPRTRLMEERLYGWMRNHLWWLEGEALYAATVSGACYALRRSALHVSSEGARALDVRLAAAAAAAGRKVRLFPRARACEMRVPQSLREFTRFRRRRGAGYLAELLAGPPVDAPWRWRLTRAVRLWHFRVVPHIGVAVLALALALTAMGQWSWPLAALAAFAGPPLLAVLWARPRRWLRMLAAGTRLVVLTWLSVLALDRLPELPARMREAA
jgi:cellulose synthase/poly-beta-1,6-N-acetylglucosamine synthase-like glycosyltransferase